MANFKADIFELNDIDYYEILERFNNFMENQVRKESYGILTGDIKFLKEAEDTGFFEEIGKFFKKIVAWVVESFTKVHESIKMYGVSTIEYLKQHYPEYSKICDDANQKMAIRERLGKDVTYQMFKGMNNPQNLANTLAARMKLGEIHDKLEFFYNELDKVSAVPPGQLNLDNVLIVAKKLEDSLKAVKPTADDSIGMNINHVSYLAQFKTSLGIQELKPQKISDNILFVYPRVYFGNEILFGSNFSAVLDDGYDKVNNAYNKLGETCDNLAERTGIEQNKLKSMLAELERNKQAEKNKQKTNPNKDIKRMNDEMDSQKQRIDQAKADIEKKNLKNNPNQNPYNINDSYSLKTQSNMSSKILKESNSIISLLSEARHKPKKPIKPVENIQDKNTPLNMQQVETKVQNPAQAATTDLDKKLKKLHDIYKISKYVASICKSVHGINVGIYKAYHDITQYYLIPLRNVIIAVKQIDNAEEVKNKLPNT